MIERLPCLAPAILQIGSDITLEVIKCAIGNEDVRECDITFPADAQQFDLPAIVRKAFERQFDVGLTDELNLQTQSDFKVLLALVPGIAAYVWIFGGGILLTLLLASVRRSMTSQAPPRAAWWPLAC